MLGLDLGLLTLELFAAGRQPRSPRPRIAQLAWQLVTARLAQPLIVGGVGRGGLLQHRLDLGADRRIRPRGADRGVALDQASIQCHHADRHQPGPRAQRQHLREGLGQRLRVTHPKARDGGVIGRAVGAQHAERDVLAAAPLDRPRRALANRVGIQQQGDHHPRLMRRPPPAVVAVVAVERRQIDRLDRVDHEPGQMVIRQPVAQARRQQERLLTITREEVLAHPTPPQPTTKESSSTPRTDKPRRSGVCATAS